MNNRQTNRRRGRGNNRAQNNNRNGFDNQNRIDNRARGNASQMLEKYKKLASDSQLNGDRVTSEYYLQFADHYFRVLADFRSRQDENRAARGEWRNDDREGGDEREWRDDDRDGQDAGSEAEPVEAEAGEEEDRRPRRNDRNDRNDRNQRGRRDRYEERDGNRIRADERDEGSEDAAGLDLSVLPPSIAMAADEYEGDPIPEDLPVRKPRGRRPKSANDEDIVTAAE